MARGVNKAILIGNLGADPEVRFMPNGKAVANVRLATAESWRDRETGQQQERTEWHRVTFYSPLADIVKEYLRKGSQIYVEGKIQTRKWQDKDGQDRYTTEIVANEMHMLGGRSGTGGTAPMEREAPASRPMAQGSGGFDAPPPADFDDDIPF